MIVRLLALVSFLPFMLLSFAASAETNGSSGMNSQYQMQKNMNNPKMQNMMMELQKVQGCMSKVDLNEIDKLTQKANSIQQECVHLCQQGKRDAAQAKMTKYAKEIQSNKDVKKMKSCLKGIDNPSVRQQLDRDLEIDTSKHVCDLIDNYTTAP